MSARRWFTGVGFLLLMAVAPLTGALAATDATGVVADFGDRALKMLNDPGLSPADRQRQFHALLDQDFDFNTVARFVLGRYWQTATDEQKQQFAQVFKDYVVQTYSKRFSEFSDTSFKVTGQRPEGNNATIVRTDVMRQGSAQPAHVDWRVVKAGDGYKITEVSVDGISMSLTHRQEFASIMERNGGNVADLIAQLRAKIGT
jgi:phospholipid transport system substrate-binding protein